MYRMKRHHRWNDLYAYVCSRMKSKTIFLSFVTSWRSDITWSCIHMKRQTSTVGFWFFCDRSINIYSVSKLPSLRHFPTNRLSTLCLLPPLLLLLPTSSLPLFICLSLSLSSFSYQLCFLSVSLTLLSFLSQQPCFFLVFYLYLFLFFIIPSFFFTPHNPLFPIFRPACIYHVQK